MRKTIAWGLGAVCCLVIVVGFRKGHEWYWIRQASSKEPAVRYRAVDELGHLRSRASLLVLLRIANGETDNRIGGSAFGKVLDRGIDSIVTALEEDYKEVAGKERISEKEYIKRSSRCFELVSGLDDWNGKPVMPLPGTFTELRPYLKSIERLMEKVR